MAVFEVSVPEERNGRAHENAAHQSAEAVCDDSAESEPAGQAGSTVDEEAEELTEDRAFHEGEAKVIDDDAGPEWLLTWVISRERREAPGEQVP